MPGFLRKLKDAISEGRDAREAHGAVAEDPVFGRITYDRDGFWQVTASLGPFGDAVEVDISAPGGQPPSDAQRRAYQGFVTNLEGLHREVERANYDFYNEVVIGNWRQQEIEARPEDEDLLLREMPDIEDPALLWKWLSDLGVHIPEQDEHGWRVELVWGDCHWDEEHGWAVTIQNGEVLRFPDD